MESNCDFPSQNETEMDEYYLYEDIVNHSTNGVYVIGENSHKLLYINKEMEKILAEEGIGDAIGKKCYCALRHKNSPCEECFAYPSFDTEYPQEVYIDILSKYYSVVSRSIQWQGEDAYVIYLSDISDEKRALLELAKTKKKLTAAITHTGLAYWEYD
ncbi:MAG: hypothetical protein RR162_06710, partial [Oscillospiraceae bacterium]